jgi:DNA-binding transcriptional MerR regulator/methylmalonyl-CoA mutase cobalamin-binding subunit
MQPDDSVAGLPISSVERETGLSKDTLRVWERRYGFPTPERDANGERSYSLQQVRRLTQLKRLLDQGHRPGKLLKLDEEALSTLLGSAAPPAIQSTQQPLDEWLQRVRLHDNDALQRDLQREINRHGLARFVQDIAAPLINRVGSAWSNQEIGVFEEHLFSQNLEKLFHSALANLSQPKGCPRVLLTTLSGEEHTLGLLMVEALLALEEACPIQLGAQTPISEIVRAVRLERIDVVCLSFSSAYLPALAQQGLRDLRQQLPAEVELWAGGHGVKAIRRPIEGVCLTLEFDDLHAALRRWRALQESTTLHRHSGE